MNIIDKLNNYLNEDSIDKLKTDVKYIIDKNYDSQYVKFTGKINPNKEVEVTDGTKSWYINPNRLTDSRIGLVDRMAERRKSYKVKSYVTPEKSKIEKVKDFVKKEFTR